MLTISVAAAADDAHHAAVGKLMFIGWSDRRIILAHESIEAPGLGMKNTVFYFDGEEVLRGLGLGDWVLFHAERRDGKFMLTHMQKTDVGDDEHHH